VTAYFDTLQRRIGAASERCRGYDNSEAQFLLEVGMVEARAVRAVEAVTKLDGFPDDLRQKIARAIAKASTSDALGYRLATRSSDLIGDLHSIFHDVATRKIQTPFGVLSDDPVGTLKRLDGNGKDAFEDHIDTCPDCDTHVTLGDEKFCERGDEAEKQWGVVHMLMTEGVPTDEWPK
jgi:hypothetical protein